MPPVGSFCPVLMPENSSICFMSEGVTPKYSESLINNPKPQIFPAPENSSLITSAASNSGDSKLYDSISIGVNVAVNPGIISRDTKNTAKCTFFLSGMSIEATFLKSLITPTRTITYLIGCIFSL